MDESFGPILRFFKIIPASKENLIAFGILVGFVIVLIVMVQVILHLIWRRKYLLEEWDWFYRMCEAKDFSVKEMKILREMIRRSKVKKPTDIFKSMKLFDKCVDFEFKKLKLNDEEREEFTEDISEIRSKLHFDRFLPGKILQSTRGIIPDQRVRVTFVIDGEKHYTVSKIVDVKEDSIHIFMPRYNEYKDFLNVGQNIEVYFWRTGDAGYSFPTKIKSIVDEYKGLLEIDHSNSVERTQRRHYYRIDTSLKLFFRPLEEEQKSLLKENKYISFPYEIKPYIGKILSISGGGISFVSDITFPNGEILWLEIFLSKSQTLSDIYGRVIRSKKVPDNKFKLFIEFVLIEEKEREIIIEFVTAKQREKVKV